MISMSTPQPQQQARITDGQHGLTHLLLTRRLRCSPQWCQAGCISALQQQQQLK